MSAESVTEPGVIERVELDPELPTPEDCLPPGETPIETAELEPGWVAVTDRELLTYHPDRDPAVRRVLRPNVTGLVVQRAGGRRFVSYAPMAILYSLGALVLGAGMLAVDPIRFVTVPDAPGVESMITIVRTLGWAMNLLGAVLVFTGVLAVLVAITVVLYWFRSREVALVIERGDADPIACRTTRPSGQRAVRKLRGVLAEERSDDSDDEATLSPSTQ